MNNLYGLSLGEGMLPKMEARVLPWVYIRGDLTHRLQYPLNRHSLVYDVGAYKGDWAEAIFDLYGCRIKAFEPVQRFLHGLEEMFDGNNKVDILHYGLGGKNRTEKINVDWEASSVFKSGGKIEKIKIVDASKVMGKDVVDLMKINIEGGEYELLNRLIDTGQIAQIKNIQVQFHDFVKDAERKRSKLHQRLQKTHHLTYCYPFVWENWEINA